MKKNKLMRIKPQEQVVEFRTVINVCEQMLINELSYASVGLGMTPEEFKKREVTPFITLYIFIFTLLNIMSWGPFPFFWQLAIILLTSVFAYYGFSYLYTVRRERETRWRREQGYSDGYDHQHLLQKREQAIIHLLRQMDCCSNHYLDSINQTLDKDLEKRIVKDYPSHLRGAFVAVLWAIFHDISLSPMSINSLFTPKILKAILSYIAVIAIFKLRFFIQRYFSLSYRRKKELQNVLKSIQHKLDKKKKS
ncbi:hypothetical protein [Sphingobacterium thalpophilum]|uniref:hypothetical protein n=1 Tax=Sphingobacterium thalpophilum TaxID=259 RepID=UPI003C76594A